MQRNLVIVAHPDDETIWMGGTILDRQKEKWTIISLCRKEDPDREVKFNKVCRELKASCIISDIEDEKLNPIPVDEIADKIKSILPGTEYDLIYTHGNNGEYGHQRHKEIHKAVKKLVKKKELKCKKLLAFSYKLSNKNVPKIPQLKIPIPNKESDEHIELSEDNFKRKVSLVKNMYGFGGESFEVLSCNRIEAFNQIK
jgi:LmbE family N-acetylglucosaminyl deacetylase